MLKYMAFQNFTEERAYSAPQTPQLHFLLDLLGLAGAMVG